MNVSLRVFNFVVSANKENMYSIQDSPKQRFSLLSLELAIKGSYFGLKRASFQMKSHSILKSTILHIKRLNEYLSTALTVLMSFV